MDGKLADSTFQDTVQNYAECHLCDLNKSNATIFHEIKVGILNSICTKEKCLPFKNSV